MGEVVADSFGVLDRITAIFEAFDEDDRGLRISELAARADLPKSTVSRLVSALVRQHYLERDGMIIHLGLRLFELGQLAEEPRELRAIAFPVLADLRNVTGKTAYLAIRDADEMVCVAIMRGSVSTPLICRIGGRVPAHTTALGKATAEGRVAVDVEEFISGVTSVAAPVLWPSGAGSAAIGVSGDSNDVEPDGLAVAVRAAALTLGRRLASGSPVAAARSPH